jgi:hypothetical protein
MKPDDFPVSLMRAASALGSLLDVALLLEVEPRQVYRWLADLDRPSGEYLRELERRLR